MLENSPNLVDVSGLVKIYVFKKKLDWPHGGAIEHHNAFWAITLEP